MPQERKQLLIGGAVVFWRLASRFSYETLRENLTQLSLEKFCPEVRTHESALKEALKDVTHRRSSDLLIRPLRNSRTDGYAVVREDCGETCNTYSQEFTAKVDEHGSISVNPYDSQLLGELYQAFNEHKGTVTNTSVAKCLVELLEHFGATALRDKGGFYWLHEDRVAEWYKVAEAVENSTDPSEKTQSAIYLLRTKVDSLSARAVRDAIIAEVRSRAQEIKDRASVPGLKRRAYQTKQHEAQALHERVKYFEEILGEALSELHQVADECESEVVSNAIQAIPDFFGPVEATVAEVI